MQATEISSFERRRQEIIARAGTMRTRSHAKLRMEGQLAEVTHQSLQDWQQIGEPTERVMERLRRERSARRLERGYWISLLIASFAFCALVMTGALA